MHDRSASAPLDPSTTPGRTEFRTESRPESRPVLRLRPGSSRSLGPQLTVLRGGRADAGVPFVVAPPALQRLDRVVTPAEIDMLRCRRVWRTVR